MVLLKSTVIAMAINGVAKISALELNCVFQAELA